VGTEITKERFGERDYARFRERLEQCLTDLERLLGRPGFGTGPVTIGAELELCLVDDAARPLPRNTDVRALAADPRITLELNRFNLELNTSPALLAGPRFPPVHRARRRTRRTAGPDRRGGPGARRPGRADRHPAHVQPSAPGPGHGDRHGPLPRPG
jgi:hypothetical protein